MHPLVCYLSTAHVLINELKLEKVQCPGLEAKLALLTVVCMNINCYLSAKVYFKMACVHVHV